MVAKLSALALPFQRIEGVDGRKMSFPTPDFCALSYGIMHGRRTSPPEVGCYLSHVECMKAFLRGDADFALVLEDDVVFDDDFVQTIDNAICHAETWDILRLSTVNSGRKYPFKQISSTRTLSISLTREKGAGAYIVNRQSAEWISTKLMPMRLAYDIAFDTEYLSGLKAAFVYPLCATQDADQNSQIQDGLRRYRLPRWRYLSVLPFRAYLETTRFLCRSYRLMTYSLKYRLMEKPACSPSTPVCQSQQIGDVTPASHPV